MVLLFGRVFILVCLGTVSRTVWGAEILVTPSCDIREEFNDNVLLSTGSRQSDLITTVAPGLGLSRNTERSSLNLSAGLNQYWYVRNEDMDSLDYTYQGQLAYKLTPRDDFGLGGTFSHTSRPDTLNQATGLATSSGANTYSLSTNAGRSLDATTSASVTYSYQRQTYDNPSQVGSITHNAGLGLSKDLSSVLSMLKGTVNASYTRAIYSNSSNDNYSLSVGVSRNINEKIAWSLSGGANYTYSNFLALSQSSSTVVTNSSDNWGWIGSAGLIYTGEKAHGSISFSQNFVPSSGQIGATEATAVALTLGRTETKRLNWQLSATYNINRSSNNQFASMGTNERAYQFGANAQYKLSDYFDLGLQYSYYADSYRNIGTQADQNKVLLTLSSHGKFRLIGTNTLINEVSHGTR